MRITKIAIKDFRAFRGEYEIDLHKAGHNLLVYGENGSGKSSLFQALNLFLESDTHKPDFAANKNIFIATNDGYVKLDLGDGTNPDVTYEWSEVATPHSEPLIIEASKTKGILDYKSLLETYFVHRQASAVNIFDLLIKTLIANTQNPITRKNFAQEWEDIQKLIATRWTKRITDQLKHQLDDFNTGISAVLKDLLANANNLLNNFQQNVTINFEVQPVDFLDNPKKLVNCKILLKATYYGNIVDQHHRFLNESRLSAIALAIYLGALLLNPASRLKVLALDDVLIGLDMSNRIPLLDILRNHFADWQIVLITYDKTWFEIVDQRTQGENWTKAELYCKCTDQFDLPVYYPNKTHLQKAQTHLDANDLKAAVIYLRTAFEEIIKGFCSKHCLPVRYRLEAKHFTSEDFWTPIKTGKKKDGTPFVDIALVKDVELYRSLILNPISHAATISPIRKEVDEALKTVQKLKRVLDAIT